MRSKASLNAAQGLFYCCILTGVRFSAKEGNLHLHKSFFLATLQLSKSTSIMKETS